MWYLEASDRLRLRPSHLLLMVYRYHSGIYQTGDLSALNYVKGVLDARGRSLETARILAVSGHGIGEAEMWLANRLARSKVESVSSRLVDTQLLHFLRTADRKDVETVFHRFQGRVAGYPALASSVADKGLVPYWANQADLMRQAAAEGRLSFYSDAPYALPEDRRYDLIYVSHGAKYLTPERVAVLRDHLSPGGCMAVLLPAPGDSGNGAARFACTQPVLEAKRGLERFLASREYALSEESVPHTGIEALATRSERILFSVMAPAASVLLGELILRTLGEHISERVRLEALDAVVAGYQGLEAPVNEELILYLVEATA